MLLLVTFGDVSLDSEEINFKAAFLKKANK